MPPEAPDVDVVATSEQADRLGHLGVRDGESLVWPLVKAATRGDLEGCRTLLLYGAPASSAGNLALSSAAGGGHIEICRLLLDWGAKADDAAGWALTQAARRGHLDICRLLLAHGAQASECGSRALVCAADGGHSSVCQLLVAHGASILDMHDKSQTTLLSALGPGDVAFARTLFPGLNDEDLSFLARAHASLDLADAITASMARESTSPRLSQRLRPP